MGGWRLSVRERKLMKERNVQGLKFNSTIVFCHLFGQQSTREKLGTKPEPYQPKQREDLGIQKVLVMLKRSNFHEINGCNVIAIQLASNPHPNHQFNICLLMYL